LDSADSTMQKSFSAEVTIGTISISAAPSHGREVWRIAARVWPETSGAAGQPPDRNTCVRITFLTGWKRVNQIMRHAHFFKLVRRLPRMDGTPLFGCTKTSLRLYVPFVHRMPRLTPRCSLRCRACKLLRKDLQAAEIPYKDSLGRQVDFHSLRHTFGTNLSLAGVKPRVAMELMRHSDLRLTMKTYTDATRLPTADAIDSLPGLNTGCSQLCSQKMFPDSPSKSQAVPAEDWLRHQKA
jgi:hypothetical protein